MNTVISALQNQLTLQENFSCIVKQFALTSGAVDTDNTFAFPANLGRQIVELNAFCTNADGSYTPVYPQVSWNYVNGQVMINGIKGLTLGKTYNFTVTVK